jgi:hypothetical protein
MEENVLLNWGHIKRGKILVFGVLGFLSDCYDTKNEIVF